MESEGMRERMDLFAEWKRMSDVEQRGLHQWWLDSPGRVPEWPFGLFAMSTSTIVSALKKRRDGTGGGAWCVNCRRTLCAIGVVLIVRVR